MKKYQGLKYVGLLIALSLPVLVAYPAYATDGDITKVQNFLTDIIDVAIKLTISVGTLTIVFAGAIYATNGGSPERLTKAKNAIMWACIGIAIAVFAATISAIVNQMATKSVG